MPSHWLEIKLEVTRSQAEAAEDALLAAGAQALTLHEVNPNEPVLEPPPGATPLWPEVSVTGLFAPEADAARVCAALESESAPLKRTPHCRLIEDRDWVRSWLAHYRPMRFGRRLWVQPRAENPAPEGDAVAVRLDPGLAFGTGTHASTALCLEWLDGASIDGARVIDYGCGSGILGIAALKLGGADLWSVDIDPQALIATRDNAVENGVSPRLKIHCVDDLPAVEADILVANILAAPLIALAPALSRHVRPGGQIVLSGVLARQADEVSAAYRPWFAMQAPVSREGWVRLAGTRS